MIGRSVLCVREGGSFGSELERSWCQAVQDRSPPATGAGKILSFPSSISHLRLVAEKLSNRKKYVRFFPALIFLDILSIQTEATLSQPKTHRPCLVTMIIHKR